MWSNCVVDYELPQLRDGDPPAEAPEGCRRPVGCSCWLCLLDRFRMHDDYATVDLAKVQVPVYGNTGPVQIHRIMYPEKVEAYKQWYRVSYDKRSAVSFHSIEVSSSRSPDLRGT